jgi:hypothetical protein
MNMAGGDERLGINGEVHHGRLGPGEGKRCSRGSILHDGFFQGGREKDFNVEQGALPFVTLACSSRPLLDELNLAL